MSAELELKTLSEETFSDYEEITKNEGGGGCYCAFWHQKWTDMKGWEAQCKEHPDSNRAIVAEKMRAGFHIGVMAYENSRPVAWICVGPLTDFYWTWKRLAAVGECRAMRTHFLAESMGGFSRIRSAYLVQKTTGERYL